MDTSRRFARLSGLLALSLLFLGTGRAQAAFASVGCSGAVGSFDYSSITAALNALAALSHRNHHIAVSGTCSEVVRIAELDEIRIVGTAGAMVVDPGAAIPFGFGIFEIGGSRNVHIENLTVRGSGPSGRAGVHIANSTVTIRQSVIEHGGNGGGGGVFIHGSSAARIFNSTIQDNSPNGVRVDGPSEVVIGQVSNDSTPTVIQRNGAGVTARLGGQARIHGATVIQDNGTGLNINGGGAGLCCAESQRQIVNNNTGIAVTNGGSIEINGPALIDGNRSFGLIAIGGHVRLGVGTVFSNNGTPGLDPGFGGGAVARIHGVLEVLGAEITNNVAGIVGTEGALVRIVSGTIAHNAGHGVRIQMNSSLRLFGGGVMNGNAGFDLSCTPDSAARGDRRGVARMFCPRFDDAPSGVVNPDPRPGSGPQ